MNGSLEGPRLKIERAKKHIRELDVEVQRFLARDPYSITRQDDSETGKKSAPIVNVREDPPPCVALLAGDAVHNLRSALDLLVWQLVLANGQTPGDHTTFPILKADSESGMDGKIKGVSAPARTAIKALKPYKGGNESLWSLHRLDATDKHRLLLTTGLAWGSTAIVPDIPGLPAGAAVPGLMLQMNRETFFPLENGAELESAAILLDSLAAMPVKMNVQFGFDVAFGEGGAVKGEPLVPTLVQLADYVGRVVESFGPLF